MRASRLSTGLSIAGGVSIIALLTFGAPSCSSGNSSSGDAGAGGPLQDGGTCAQGFAPSNEANGLCAEISPPGDCPAGSAPILGSADCTPVGWTAPCPDGFVKDPGGWGCIDQTPAAACSGATRETLHSTSCVTVGDCSATPPAGALLVDDSFTAGQLDATHFQTISAALSAASSGATVWVMAGSYTEALSITKPLSLIGQCPDQVTVLAPPQTAIAGIDIVAQKGVTVSGLTIRGGSRGVNIVSGSDVTLESDVVDQSIGAGVFVEASNANVHATKISATAIRSDGTWGWGIAAGLGSTVTADDATIIGGVNGVFAASTGTKVTLQGSVIARQAPTSSTRSTGVTAGAGGDVSVVRSVIRDVIGDGTVVADQGGHVEVSESVLRGTRVQGSQARGHGVVAIATGQLTIRSSAILDNESLSIDAQNAGSHLEIDDSVVRGPSVSHAQVDSHLGVSSEKSGIGMQVLDHATSKLDGVALLGAWGFGIYATSSGTLDAHHLFIDQTQDLKTPDVAGAISFAVGVTVDKGGKVTLADSTILHGRLAAASAGAQGTLDVSGSLLRDVGEATPLGTGAGLSTGEGGSITATRSAVVHTSGIGVLAVNRGNSSVTMTDSVVHNVHAASTGFGHGAMAGPQTSFTFERTAFYDNESVALALAGGSAKVTSSIFAKNAIALHVQDGSYLVESSSEDTLGDGELRVSSDTTFEGNGTKVGNDAVPLPSDPLK